MTKRTARYYIGLMSGTSADGIDLALVEFIESTEAKAQPKLLASYYQAYSTSIAEKITSLYKPNDNEIDRAFELDVELAQCFSQAITALLIQENLTADDIIAIGSHGQTIRHRPLAANPFTLQIGCCQTLACLTAIRVIGQFRVKDIALGGQGAPLVPAFHQQLFVEKNKNVFVVNIGGIANISFLPAQTSAQQVMGFDTGPGNALLDDWFKVHHVNATVHYDKNGVWAKQGQVNQALLKQLLNDDYFALTAPKSTGREYFHLAWLNKQLAQYAEEENQTLSAPDVQATLTGFTAITIVNDIKRLAENGRVYLCGGGVHNQQLVDEIKQLLFRDNCLNRFELLSTSANGVDGDLLEAIAFAWLAYAYDNKLPSNMPSVTGASKSCTLGAAFLP
jgi:anhydro-N-acetylmuramic acid kinase